MNAIEPLSSDEMAALDAAYRPFPSFSDWPANPPRPDMWTAALRTLETAKASASEHDLDRASRTAMRAAAFDTGAIEQLYDTDRGLTITVAMQAAAWEAVVNERAPNALALFHAQLRAYDLVLDAATQSLPVTETWIRRLHEELTEPQETYVVHTPVGQQEQPLPRGEYKKYPNHVQLSDGTHSYAPVLDTPVEMDRLVDELTSDEFAAADPVLQASYAHYALVAIHPFADGNGRVARALSSVYLYRAATIPLLVFVDQKNDYFASLEAADKGRPEAFVHFVAATARSTMALVTETISTEQSPDLDDSARALRQMISYRENLSAEQFEEIAGGLVDALQRLATERIASLDLPAGIEISIRSIQSALERPLVLRLVSSSSPPADVQMTSDSRVDIDSNDPERSFRVTEVDGRRQSPVELALRDVYPNLTVAGELRLRGFVERWLAFDVAKLQEAVAGKLQASA